MRKVVDRENLFKDEKSQGVVVRDPQGLHRAKILKEKRLKEIREKQDMESKIADMSNEIEVLKQQIQLIIKDNK